jgi:hypothetical protein
VRYLGFEALPEGALPGDQVSLVHYWVATQPLERPYWVFVHALVQGAMGWVAHADHLPAPSPDHWPVGRTVRDEHALVLPADLPGARVDLRVGLYLGNDRLPVDAAEKQDGQDRILAGGFAVAGREVPRPSAEAPQLARPPRLDGVIGDAEWADAAWLGPFVPSRGDGTAAQATRARIAWDPAHLYLAFDAEDPDLQGSMVRRDDPIYREESLEIFIDPTCSRRDYVELQASPRGTLFDAAFSGGARRNMRTEFDARYEVATALDGSLNDPADRDRSWRAEWAIEVASIPGVLAPLGAGESWCLNLFRIGKDRMMGEQRADESAWSAPLQGDFHNPERFGVVRLRALSAPATTDGRP